MNKQNPPKGHHTVPQTNLRYFSKDGDTIYRLDKNTNKIVLLPISVISKRNDYYSFTESNGKKNVGVETAFTAPIDGRYTKLITLLTAHTPLNQIGNMILEQFSFQFGRVEKQRENIDRMMRDLNIIDPSSRKSILGMFAIICVHQAVMENSVFWVGETKGIRLITSDNPAGRGFFPFTPTLCVFSSKNAIGDEYVYLPDEVVQKINGITFSEAKRYVYAMEKKDLEYLIHP